MSEEEKKVEVAWEEAADDLKKEVSRWADSNSTDAKDWAHELAAQKIRSCRTLEEMDLESFGVLLGALKARNQAVLIQKLKIWYKEKHPESNSS
jgi:hypothetical protein